MKNLKSVSIEQEKQMANEQWDRYLNNITKDNFDPEMLAFQIQKMNNIDRRLIELNRKDLLG